MTSQPLSRKSRESGFTLVEILMVLGLVAILSVAGISVMTGSVDESRYDATVGELRQIRTALIGDTDAMQGGARSSFGYLGDLGALPSSALGLAALISKPSSLPDFAVNSSARIGLGWNGPYLNTGGTGGTFSFTDKWGRAYIYTPGTTATIVSRGADGAAGGTGMNQDIVMSIPPELQVATVYGFLSSGGGAYNNAFQAEINYPNGNGAVAQSLVSVAAGAQGAFQFNSIPLGPRSATIYVPTKAAPTQTIGPLNFVVDKARFMLPTNLTDLNPGGGGGSGGGGSNGCTSNAGRLSVGTGSSSSNNDEIELRVSSLSRARVSKIRINLPNGPSVEEIDISGSRFRCSGSRAYTPCPGPNATDLQMNRTADINGTNRSVEFEFNRDVENETSVIVDFHYDGGCDRLTFTGLR